MNSSSRTLVQNLVQVAVMLVVSDIAKSVRFYHELLGFEVIEQESYLAHLERASLTLYLVTESEPTPDKPGVTLEMMNRFNHTSVNLIFRVTDCQQAYRELAGRGMKFFTPPQTPEWGGGPRCFAADPDGYLIQLEQAP